MRKLTFNNQIFFWIIILMLSGLLLWNLYVTIAYSKLIGLLPAGIQLILLILILIKHKYAKIGIKIWAILFLAIGSGLQFFGRFIQDITSGFENVNFEHYLSTGIKILIGVIIVFYTNKTVEIKIVDKIGMYNV